MKTAHTTTRAVADIRVRKRHRRDLGDIEALAASIAAIGLINPITIDEGGRLLAGAKSAQVEPAQKVAALSAPSRAIRERRDLRHRKARGPAADTVNSPHAASQASELKGRNATADQDACPTVYDGTNFVGSIVERADGSFDAFDAAGRHLGTFRNQREAVRAIPARGEA